MRWDAEMYDSTHGPQAGAGRELIRMASVKPADHILDIGCGTGTHTLELARMAFRGMVVGIDPSPEMLERARTVAASCDNIAFMNMAAEDISFAGKFDLIFSNSAFQWISQQEAVIEKTCRALKGGGRLALQMPAKDFCWALMDNIGGAFATLGLERKFRDMASPWRFLLKEEMAVFMRNAGFRQVDVFYRDYTIVFESINEALDWGVSAALRPFLSELPESRHARFKYAFAMGFENFRTEKGIEFGFKRLFAMGEK